MTTNDKKAIQERGFGALLGQAAGDALGTTVEFKSASAIRRMYRQALKAIVGGGPFGVAAGQITDDTELALALARSLAEKGAYDADHVASRYLAWYRSGPFDVGNATRQAFGGEVRKGRGFAEQVEARASKSTQANGSLMRISPLGVFGWDLDPSELAKLAAQNSRLSHPDPVCQATCVVFTHAIAFAVRTGKSAQDVYEDALAFAKKEPLAATVVDSLESARDEVPADFSEKMGWVRVAFQNAFYQLLHARTLEDGIVDTVMRGGDTDTNGCIAGALLGAVHGASAVPQQWRDQVLGCKTRRPSDYWCCDLEEVARKLCARNS
jgi:ADP-ribosylglycohydrolase